MRSAIFGRMDRMLWPRAVNVLRALQNRSYGRPTDEGLGWYQRHPVESNMARFAERLFSWSSGRAADRPATFFEADELSTAQKHGADRMSLGFGMLVLLTVVATGVGMLMLLQLAKLMLV